MEFVSVGGIVSICLLVGRLVKESPIDQRWIPTICGVVGGILGVVGMILVPDFPTDNYIIAVGMGIVSGLSATGVHQAVKQVKDGD